MVLIGGDVWCVAMVNNLTKALVMILSVVTTSQAEDCYYKLCQVTGKDNCQFNIECRMEGRFAKCNVTSLTVDKLPPLQRGTTCIAPAMVPGFTDFCTELLNDHNMLPPAPANVHNENDKDESSTEVIQESKLNTDDGGCFGSTILVSVAIGCFLAGCFVTWFIMFCCKLSFCCGSSSKNEALGNDGNDGSNWNSSIHSRPIGSTSSAQLLGNASLETMSTNNTLLSNGDSPPFHDVTTLDRLSGAQCTDFQSSLNRYKRQQGEHKRSPSAAWIENRSPLLPSARSQSAQWNLPRQSTLPNISSRTSHWARTEGISQGASFTWNSKGLPTFTNEHSSSAPWLDNIYSPASESSSRDYQSIQGGSENPYAPYSESSSDYSAPHRVMIIRDGEIYQASSESSGSNNDYTSLKGQRFGRQNDVIYYPTSEGSNKDYASLLNDKEANEATGNDSAEMDGNVPVNKDDSCKHKSFNVSGLTFPVQASCRSNFGWTSNLEEIHEYETVESTRKDEDSVNVGNVTTIADMCDVNHNKDVPSLPHEYFKLEPVQSENK